MIDWNCVIGYDTYMKRTHHFEIILPVGLFLLYFLFYNFGKVTFQEMIKTSGLLAISLLAITLLVGPLCRFFPSLAVLKTYRKTWGITSFFVALVHGMMAFAFYFKLNPLIFFDAANPKYSGILSGLSALIILFFVTLSSNKKFTKKIKSGVWKTIQLTSYLAILLAVSHFFLMEQAHGVLVIKRLLGQITFWFSLGVIMLRLGVILFG